jgi:hypothetical protein
MQPIVLPLPTGPAMMRPNDWHFMKAATVGAALYSMALILTA